MSKKNAIQATRKHGKHYSVLNANNRNNHKKWDFYENLTLSDFSESDVDQSSSCVNGQSQSFFGDIEELYLNKLFLGKKMLDEETVTENLYDRSHPNNRCSMRKSKS